MPELPEVETVKRGLVPVLEGRVLTEVIVRRSGLRKPFPESLARRLTGRRVTGLARRAKYILAHLDDGYSLLFHLGMSGRMIIGGDGKGKHDHLILITEDRQIIVFNDPRRFGLVDLFVTSEINNHYLLGQIGLEPFAEELTDAHFYTLFKGKSANIKSLLLDQRIIAGLGNIYVCEALFLAKISPVREARTITKDEAMRLLSVIRVILSAAIKAGGSSLRDHRRPDGEIGYFQYQFSVYGKEGKPCPDCDCAGGVVRLKQGGRSTFYCPVKQGGKENPPPFPKGSDS